MSFGSKGNVLGATILLGSGQYLDIDAIPATRITLEDLAFGLAHEGRWAGQCLERKSGKRVFFSVGQHSVWGAYQCPDDLKYPFLMHEVGEFVMGDLCGPIKQRCLDYKATERRIEHELMERWAVPHDEETKRRVKEIDLRMMATERRDLMNWDGEYWDYIGDAQPFQHTIMPWSNQRTARNFMGLFLSRAPQQALDAFGLKRNNLVLA